MNRYWSKKMYLMLSYLAQHFKLKSERERERNCVHTSRLKIFSLIFKKSKNSEKKFPHLFWIRNRRRAVCTQAEHMCGLIILFLFFSINLDLMNDHEKKHCFCAVCMKIALLFIQFTYRVPVSQAFTYFFSLSLSN